MVIQLETQRNLISHSKLSTVIVDNSNYTFLASPDALEVIVVTYLLSVSTDLSDVTLVSDDIYLRLD